MPEWISNVLQNALDFSNTLNVSITASWLILAVVLLRFLLKKAPKWIHVTLWGLVAVRLIFPISIESVYSLVPSTETIPREILTSEGTQLHESAYLEVITNPSYAKDVTVELEQSVDRVQIRMMYMTFVWWAGMVAMLLYTVISYLCLHRKVSTAVLLRDNIFQSENVSSPFVLGVIRPRIYLPFRLETQELDHVVAHEKAHIFRKDHWWKPLGFFLLTIHWFNPLMWLAYILLCRDIELACDEKVIKTLNNAQRADYTQALVSCSTNRRIIAACPLAFGEVGVKERVKSVMNYKRPAFWLIVLAVIAGIFLAVCFLTNPKQTTVYDIFEQESYTVLNQEQLALTLSVSKSQLPDTIYTPEGYEFEEGEVVAYQTDTTTIYLRKAMLSNESDEQLYFVFDCSYDLSNYGILVSPWYIDEEKGGTSNRLSLRSKDMKDGTDTYPDTLAMRGHGPGMQFAFYVSKDACKAAGEKIMIDVECNQIFYAKRGYEEEVSWQVLNSPMTMTPTSAKLTGAFDGYLYLPLEGVNYRYERTDISIEIVTRDQLLYSFTEDADPKDVEWSVYSIKEYPDLSAVWAEAGEDYKCVYQYSPSKRSDPNALSQAVEDGRVVHIDGYVKNGKDAWQEFVEAATAGKSATIKLAYYYTLDQEGYSEQYYEAFKEDYPVLYLKELAYDGNVYTLKWAEGSTEYVREYQYLMYYTGEAPAAKKASYDTVLRYVLTNDDQVSWEDLQKGLYSSQLGDYIDHYTVYTQLQ